MLVYRVRARKENGRTEIEPINFRSEDAARRFIDGMNKLIAEKEDKMIKYSNNGPGIVAYEMASCKRIR